MASLNEQLIVNEEEEEKTDKSHHIMSSMAAGLEDDSTSEATPLLYRRVTVNHTRVDPEVAILQASVFIEDGIHYRSIHHKIDPLSLKFYNIYHSFLVQCFLNITVFIILILAFFEYPTSLKLSSDYRYANITPTLREPPCGATESVEIVCLVIFLIKALIQCRLLGLKRFFKQPWLVLYFVMVVLSFFDLSISFGFCVHSGQSSLGSTIRMRRFFRPFFFLVPSSIMKKFVKAVMRTCVQISSVLVLLVIHLYVFAMIGMLIFPRPLPHRHVNTTDWDDNEEEPRGFLSRYGDFSDKEGQRRFKSVEDSLISLLVFLTTANNPDVMTQIYQYNRLSFIYFFIFLCIGLYLILNLLTAAVYSEFRGFLEQSMQSSFVRRVVAYRAAFTVLAQCYRSNSMTDQVTSKDLVRQLLRKAKIPKNHLPAMYTALETEEGSSVMWTEFRVIFNIISKDSNSRLGEDVHYYSRFKVLEILQKLVRHNAFQYFTICMTLIHIIIVTVEMESDYYSVVRQTDSALAIVNFIFFFYYIFEQLLKIIGLGGRIYFKHFLHIFEGVVTIAIVITEITILAMFGHPFHHSESEPPNYATLIRVMNLFIVFRMLRIIPQVKSVSFVFGTMVEIVKNLRAFAGIIIVIYYLFALLGMEIFGRNHKLENDTSPAAYRCGTYEQLEYYSYNFHDFAASLVILWNIMVVNNWSVFLDAFSRSATKWSQLYFVAWWLVAVIIIVNLFISLVIEVFLTRWEAYHEHNKRKNGEDNRASVVSDIPLLESTATPFSAGSDIRVLLRKNLTDPPESDLLHEIHKHSDLL
ncbi:PREDICTED: two pore calcium channel protein 2-like [Amphimedon queenslandica]|uniref:Ion transport domain-containing protein n=2 Tax=Amphimedon queenslandica TaxID=400682 RepID=A0AAN0JJ15_AMPQE|nr:PREDICTED: two pore calcium channel protein 2-like [Amphimedon queenslandica]|eukprot:XP_019856673.1 PREDICTED: two pore calcium channel protein 2-like [Amphimedon queenslandica]